MPPIGARQLWPCERPRAGQRVVQAPACRIRPAGGPELAQEAERHLALHARPHLPSGEAALEARRARRLQSFLDVLDYVHRRRPPEPRQQRARQRIGVLDRPGRLAVRQPPARGVRQRQRHRLPALVVIVVEHRDRDRLRGLARREAERAAGGGIVGARRGRAVRRGVVHRHRAGRRPAERDREGQRLARVLMHPGVGHRDPHRPGDGRRHGALKPAAVRGLHRSAWQPHRHRRVRVRLDGDRPALIVPLRLAARPRDVTVRHRERRVPQRLVAQPRHVLAEGQPEGERLPSPGVLGRHVGEGRRQRRRRRRNRVGRHAGEALLVAFVVGERDPDLDRLALVDAHQGVAGVCRVLNVRIPAEVLSS